MITINKIAAGMALNGVTLMLAVVPLASYAKQESLVLEEVTVTARKKEESLQDLALSVTSVSKQLENPAVKSIQDVQNYAPNVNIDFGPASAGGATIAIRGISQQDPDKSLESPVAVILDGVVMGTTAGQMLDTFDLQQVEVLRGPQGTLFGKNTTGGALNVTRTKPTRELGLKVKLGASEFGGREARAVINTPLTDRGGLKLLASQVESDGYMDNSTTGKPAAETDFKQFGFSVAYDLTDSFDVLLSVDKINDNSDRGAFGNFNDDSSIACLASAPFAPILFPLAPAAPVGSGCMSTDPGSDEDHVSTNGKNEGSIDNTLASLTMNWTLGSWKWTSITGYQERNELSTYEWDSSQVQLLTITGEHDYSQFSQELRVNGDLTDRINITAGLYYFDSDYMQSQSSHDMWYYLAALDPSLSFLAPFAPGDITQDLKTDGTNEVKAIFASLDWRLTDALTLNLGGRYTWEEKTYFGYQVSAFTSKTYGTIVPFMGPTNLKDEWNEFSPRVSLQYEINADLMVYASYANGFKSGGYFARTTDVAGLNSFDPEFVETYELGTKSEWLNRRLRLNATVFWTDYTDKQEDVLIPTEGGQVNSHIKNAGEAELKGVELEMQAQITSGLSMYMMAGFLDAEYTEFFADVDGEAYPGEGEIKTDNTYLQFRNAPEKTFGLGFDYVLPVSFGEFSTNYSYRWSDEYETEFFNDPRGHVNAMGIHNLSLNLSIADKYKISLYGRNLTDERYARLVKIGPISQMGMYSPPRIFGVAFTADF